jgi:O-antigen ligase
MEKNPTTSEAGGGIFEYILLAACIAVMACRATLTEAPGTGTSFEDNIFNTAASALLIFGAISWFISNICKKQFKYRFSGIEYGLAIFMAASVVGVFIASNKREAINSSIMLIAPMLMAALLTQIINSNVKVKVLLYVIAALGAVNAFECIDQYASSNQMTISEYERDPNSMLRRLHIEPGSFQQMLFEHRLYSKDIRGFFTTGNSAGSFLLLALGATVALVAEKRKALKAGIGSSGELAARGLVAAMIVVGLALTHSKGAVTAACAAALIFVIYALAGDRLARHKRAAVGILLILIVVCGAGVIWYGITHGTLPGGKSMLVRWQYWVGAARMYAAHALTGAGPGSFAQYYPTYKIPAALETVKDPHNFVLSILTQYGPLGLAGFLAALLVPLGYTVFSNDTRENAQKQDGPSFRKISLSLMVLTVAVLLAVRPLVLRGEFGDSLAVNLLVITWLYLLPAAIFTAAFLFLSINEAKTYLGRVTQAIVLCVIAGAILHNLVDYALFEPGVYTTFWALIAVLAAMNFNQNMRREYSLRPRQSSAAAAAICGFGVMWACTAFWVLPVVKSSIKIGSAAAMMENASRFTDTNSVPSATQTNILQGVFDYANRQLYSAADDDKLSPAAAAFNARLCLEFYGMEAVKDEKLLDWAQNRLLVAIDRDPADFKNYERLAEVFTLMADRLPIDKQSEILEKAYNAVYSAIERYPGSDRLRLQAGRLAQRLGKKEEAIAQYKKAIEIEDSYRVEFARMYPGKPIFSRMGEKEYQFAKERIAELTGSQ